MDQIDSFSSLPDSIIHEVLSRVDTTREAVKTRVLSKNWIHHWTHVHSLSFDHQSFNRRAAFEEFVLQVLPHHQPSIRLRKLRFFCGAHQNHSLINGVFDHATLHDLEELETDVGNFPPSLLECRTLRTLNLGRSCSFMKVSSNSLNFSWLKSLQLYRVNIDINDPDYQIFSNCPNLENVGLTSCQVSNTKRFKINAPRLVQLTIINIDYYDGLIVISGPKLKRFELKGTYDILVFEIDQSMALDELKLEMTYPLLTRETSSTWKNEFRECIISLAKRLQAHTKFLNVLFNFYVGEIRLISGPSDEGIMFIEREKECNGHLTDTPWN